MLLACFSAADWLEELSWSKKLEIVKLIKLANRLIYNHLLLIFISIIFFD